MGIPEAAPGCSVVAEGPAAEPEPDSSLVVADEVAAGAKPDRFLGAVEGVRVNPESDSCGVAAIVIVDLEPDHFPVVTEGATANSLPECPIVAEVAAQDSQSDHAATCEHFADPDVNIASMPLEPPNGQLQRSVSETPASGQAVSLLERLPVNLFGEVTEEGKSAGQAFDALEEESSTNDGFSAAMDKEGSSSALHFGAEDCSADIKASPEYEAALSEQADPGAGQQAIDLRADYSKNASSENAEGIGRRTPSHWRRKAKVQSHGRNILPRRLIPRWPLSNLHGGIIALALLDVFLVGWRTDIVRKLPQTASFYALAGLPVNLRGLAFESITTSTVREDGVPILVVEGNIINHTRKVLRVPQLRLAVRDAASQEIYSWTAGAARTSLPAGQAMTFRTRLASPPTAAHDVVLRFVNRRDIVSVIR